MKKVNKLKKFLYANFHLFNKKRNILLRKTFLFIQKKPFTSFFAVLGLFLIFMVLGNLLFSPKVAPSNNLSAPKQVKIYKLGSAPRVSYEGKIEKSGVVKIVAQMPGIVGSINVWEGQEITRGTNILSLTTNYQGGNVLSLSRQISQTQYNNAKDTFDVQKEIIGKQREAADKNRDNADKMRDIANQSATDTRALADLTRTIVDSLSSQIQIDEANNIGGVNDAAILQKKQQLSQYQSAMVGANASLRNLELQASSDQPPASLSGLSHDIAIKQLDLQEKMLNMNLEITRLQYNIALVNEANMYPSTPFSGRVDKIFVHSGENISSGTVLASISGFDQHVEIVVNVPENIAKNISAFEPSILYIQDEEINMMPTVVSKDATNGVLYSVIYQLDDQYAPKLTNLSFVKVKIAIGVSDTSNLDPFIPLDAIVQTQEEAYVYVVDDKNIARVKNIILGQIQGRYVEVLSGLPNDAQVILDRNVIENDKVSITR